MGAYQLRFLEKIPARAAVNESVELVKRARKASAAPLVNAVLRRIAKAGMDRLAAFLAAPGAEPAAPSPSPDSRGPNVAVIDPAHHEAVEDSVAEALAYAGSPR